MGAYRRGRLTPVARTRTEAHACLSDGHSVAGRRSWLVLSKHYDSCKERNSHETDSHLHGYSRFAS